MSDLKFLFLGSPQIERDGLLLSFDTRKAIALLAYLAASSSSATRETLAAMLFPEYETNRAYANLRRTLWALNSAGLGPWLAVDSEQIGLSRSANLWLDIEEFRRLTGGLPSIRDLEAAAALYRGDFLAGFSLKDSPAFDEWQFFQAESLRQEMAGVLKRLSQELAAQGVYEAAVAHARRWLSLDLLHEPAHRWLMRLYALAGRRAAAIRQYQECAQVLQDELGVEPEAETQDLYVEIRKGPQARRPWEAKRASIPAEPRAIVPPHNLPVPSTPFVGRRKELEQIQALLVDPKCRLLTLVGPGGIGKTRLAIRAAAEVLHTFSDGVCFTSFDMVKTPDAIPEAMCRMLRSSGILPQEDEPDTGDPKSGLLRRLCDRRILLIADNFEHLSAGAGVLSEMLTQAPGVKILVTSRERLSLQEEWAMDIGGLDYPIPQAPTGLERSAGTVAISDLQSYSAVVLFLQGALRVQPDFRLTPAEAQSIARICQIVHGMPLGIELAAAWLRVLPCHEIAAEIECGLDLLSSALSNVPDRHRSLRAVFDSSWRLLPLDAQEAFKRLTICRGGFDRVAAQKVAGADLAILSDLVDKSWLRRRNGNRFEVHELLRQYGGEKLDEKPKDGVAARDRHSRYYLGWLSQLNADLKGNRQQGALREIRQELDNVRAAWEWVVERQDRELVAAAADSVWIFHFFLSMFAEGERSFSLAAAALGRGAGEAAHGALLGCLLVRQGAFSLMAAQFAPAREQLERGLALCRAAGDPAETAFALNQLGNLAYASGDLPTAISRYEESLALRRGLPDRWYTASSLYNLGSLLGYFGQYGQARRLCEESLAMRRELNDRVGLVFVLGDLGSIALHQGDLASARRFFVEALVIRRELSGDIVVPHSYARGDLSDVAFEAGDFDEADKLVTESLNSLRRVGNVWNIPFALGRLALIRCAEGRHAEAKGLLEEGLRLASARPESLATANLLNKLGELLVCMGEHAEAVRCHERALALARERCHPPETAAALAGLARATFGQGDPARALALCNEALGMFRVMGARLSVAALEQMLGDITFKAGDDVRDPPRAVTGTDPPLVSPAARSPV